MVRIEDSFDELGRKVKLVYVDGDDAAPVKAMRRCPVCGELAFSQYTNTFEMCYNCGWFDDEFQEDNPDEDRCANKLSLNQARELYKKTGKARV